MLGGIRARLLSLLLVTVIPFTALIGSMLWTQWRLDQSAAVRTVLGEANRIAQHIDDEIGNFDNLLTGLSWAVSVDPADVLANDTLLQDVKAVQPGYVSNLLLTTLDGHNIGRSMANAGSARTYIGDRDFFQEIMAGKQFAVGQPVLGRTTGHWVSSIARGIMDKEGNLKAVILVGIQLERFQEGLRLNEIPPGSVVQITAADGTIIAHNIDSAKLVGRKLGPDDPLARNIAVPEVGEALVWADGVERVTVSKMSRLTAWHASVGLPVDVVLANVRARLIWGAGVALTALLAILGLAWTLSRRIIRPLRELSNDASVLASGNLSHRTAIRGQDEVGALAVTFNSMATALEVRHRELNEAREAAALEASRRSQLEQMERHAKETVAAVIDASPVAIVCSNTEHCIVLWSRAAEQTFGYTAEEAIGHRVKIVPPEFKEQSRELFDRVIKGEAVRGLEIKRRHKSGVLIDIRLSATPMYDPDGTVWGIAWSFDDITDRKKAKHQLYQLAHSDQLTGLSNRVALQSELLALLESSDRSPTAIALFDLDGFKDVNDTAGHSMGDLLLVEVAKRLRDIALDRGKVFRLGGDEFVVVVPDYGDFRLIGEIVDGMLAQLARPFHIGDHVLHIGGSAGIAIAPTDGSTVDELIANADLALYKAKSEGGRVSCFFVPALRAQAQNRRGLQNELRRAFDDKEFELHYQPQVRLTDNVVVGAEALLRWRHPTQGLVAPGAFIEALASSAIALEVGRWIVQEACNTAASWRANGLVLSRIAVNLFPCQCTAALPREIEAALQHSGLPANALELEITETVALRHDEAIAPLRALRAKGIQLAFDDFGTGYASLSYLTRYPVSRIKIDRSFVANIGDDAQDAAIVRSLIAMAHSLGLAIIAEGVEMADQRDFLLREKCEEAQGYLCGKPLPAREFESFVRSRQIESQGCPSSALARYVM